METQVSEAKTNRHIETTDYDGTYIQDLEVIERTIFIRPGASGGYSVGGRMASSEETVKVNLSQLLLDNASSWGSRAQLINAYRVMGAFGKQLGEILAGRVVTDNPTLSASEQAAVGIQSVLHSMDAGHSVQHDENGYRIVIDRCPICRASLRTGLGLRDELSHHALNVLLSTLMQRIAPELRFKLVLRPGGVHRIRVQPPLERTPEQGSIPEAVNR